MVHFPNEHTALQARTAEGDVDALPPLPAELRAGAADHGEAHALEELGDDIAELAAHLHAATYRLLVMVAEFDRRGGWGGGFRSCAHWLSWRTRLNLGAAREKVRVARALEHLPQVSDAFRRGELSYAVVRAVTRIATPANESELLQLAQHGTASHVERVVRAWRRVDRLEEQWAERERHRSRSLHLHPDDDGMYVLRARLSPEVGALLERALGAASEVLYQQPISGQSTGDQTPYAQREADAIGLVAEWALSGTAAFVQQPEMLQPDERAAEQATNVGRPDIAANDGDEQDAPAEAVNEAVPDSVTRDVALESRSRPRPARVSRAERFQVVVHVDAEALRAGSDSGQAALAGGIRISAETSRRIACDCSRVVMVHDHDGNVLDAGRRTRAVRTSIRRALEHRDNGCRFPGCNSRICDAHHIEHWIDGGPTKLSNLAQLCRRHHRAVHEDGFGMQASSDGELTFTRPDGWPLPAAPALPSLPDDCVDRLVAADAELGLEINSSTATPPWHGERLDLDYAIRGLRAL